MVKSGFYKALVFLLLFSISGCAGTEETPPDTAKVEYQKKQRKSDKQLRELGERTRELAEEHLERVREHGFSVAVDEAQLEAIQERLRELEHSSLVDLEDHLSAFHVSVMPELSLEMERLEMNLDGMGFDIEIPPIPDVPFVVELPDLPVVPDIAEIADIGVFAPVSATQLQRLFPGMTDEEILKIQAMQALAGQSAATAVPALSKIARRGKTPARRYKAVSLLARFVKKDRSVIPLLGEVAFEDENLQVRKKAVTVLGKSGDARAIDILEELVNKTGP